MKNELSQTMEMSESIMVSSLRNGASVPSVSQFTPVPPLPYMGFPHRRGVIAGRARCAALVELCCVSLAFRPVPLYCPFAPAATFTAAVSLDGVVAGGHTDGIVGPPAPHASIMSPQIGEHWTWLTTVAEHAPHEVEHPLADTYNPAGHEAVACTASRDQRPRA